MTLKWEKIVFGIIRTNREMASHDKFSTVFLQEHFSTLYFRLITECDPVSLGSSGMLRHVPYAHLHYVPAGT
jgi:hypothetical protein